VATGRDLAGLLLDVDAETLKATRNAQLAAFGLSLLVLEATRAAGLGGRPVRAVAGHSLGEYTALVAAEVLTPEEGARLVVARGEAMQAAADAGPGTMAAVLGLDATQVAEACAGVDGAWPANDNAPGQIVVAGTAPGVEAAGEAAIALGAKRVLPLPVGGAFHSPLMAPAQAPLDEALAGAVFGAADYDVVANVDAAPHRDGWADLLSAQLVSPVRWRESLLTLSGLGVTHFLELGPGSELSGMVKRTVEGAARANVATPDDLEGLAAFLDSVVTSA
jgi:[acyl-carrier-protein] S-malonyltransferase